MTGRASFLLMLAACAALGLRAEAATLYRWVGPHGVVTYQENPPPASDAGVQALHIRSGSGVPHARQAVSRAHPVTLYEAPHCPPCTEASAYLHHRKVVYKAVDVAKSQAVLRAMKARTGSVSVPTIVVGKHVLIGYSRSVLAGELTAAGYPRSPEASH